MERRRFVNDCHWDLGVILEKKQGCYKRYWGHSDCKILLLQEGNGLSHVDDNENVLCAGTKS